jgi:uncharacterized protein with PIN domain
MLVAEEMKTITIYANRTEQYNICEECLEHLLSTAKRTKTKVKVTEDNHKFVCVICGKGR